MDEDDFIFMDHLLLHLVLQVYFDCFINFEDFNLVNMDHEFYKINFKAMECPQLDERLQMYCSCSTLQCTLMLSTSILKTFLASLA